jgi:hypothetical protein
MAIRPAFGNQDKTCDATNRMPLQPSYRAEMNDGIAAQKLVILAIGFLRGI